VIWGSAPSVPDLGGRRRAELIARAGAPLTMDDVTRLRADPSATNRAEVARKLGEQYDGLADGQPRALANAVLDALVGDVAKEVRRNLAEALATSCLVPPHLARRLATDDIEVAAPLLRQSPVLSDRDLVEIVRTNSIQFALAVAGRDKVSSELADALVATGDRDVVERVVTNQGAELSEVTLRKVAHEHAGDRAIQAGLVKRPELPYDVVEQLVAAVAEQLQWDLVSRQRLDPRSAAALMAAVREQTTIALVARERGDRTLQRGVAERYAAGELAHEDLLAALRDGDVATFEAGLALHAGLEHGFTRKLIYRQDRRHLAAVCIRAGLGVTHYVMVRMAIELADASAAGRKFYSYHGRALTFIKDQYDRLRADPAKLEVLLAG
jgi:uncharacterized protein (DUF2336 family)